MNITYLGFNNLPLTSIQLIKFAARTQKNLEIAKDDSKLIRSKCPASTHKLSACLMAVTSPLRLERSLEEMKIRNIISAASIKITRKNRLRENRGGRSSLQKNNKSFNRSNLLIQQPKHNRVASRLSTSWTSTWTAKLISALSRCVCRGSRINEPLLKMILVFQMKSLTKHKPIKMLQKYWSNTKDEKAIWDLRTKNERLNKYKLRILRGIGPRSHEKNPTSDIISRRRQKIY